MKRIRFFTVGLILINPLILLGQQKDVLDYLAKNTSVFRTDSLPPDWRNYNVFALGETHNNRIATDIFLCHLFKLLNKELNVRKLIGEYSYSQTCLINKYLETNDPKLLSVLTEIDDKYKVLYAELKKLNDSLPLTKKIETEGIDFEYSSSFVSYALYLLLPNSDVKVPTEISDVVIDLRDTLTCFDWQFFTYFYGNYSKHITCYKNYLGNNFDEFNRIVESYNYSKIITKSGYPVIKKSWKIREDFMFSNMCKIIDSSDSKLLLNFGIAHCKLDSTYDNLLNCPALVSRFNSLKCFENAKVCSILMYCDNDISRNYLTKIIGSKNCRLIRKMCCPNKFHLIKLDAENSPFEKVAKEWFQYIIYFRLK